MTTEKLEEQEPQHDAALFNNIMDYDPTTQMIHEIMAAEKVRITEDIKYETPPTQMFLGHPEYKFNEGHLVEQVREYINSTYQQHYAGTGGKEIQATEFIIDAGHGTGFCIGSIMKYAKRYGKKNGYDKKDLLKIIHYAMIQLYIHDKEEMGTK